MKTIGEMNAEELAGLVCSTLAASKITATLTGGACVSIWSEGRYVSSDLDFIEEGPVPRSRIREALDALGFVEDRRYFSHPDSEYVIEFPTGPLMVGDERVRQVEFRHTDAGMLRLLSPTDCVKDRLSAFFHWKDRQALEQALLVASAQAVDPDDIRDWAIKEGAEQEFSEFERALKNA